jgi:hypothetical protein
MEKKKLKQIREWIYQQISDRCKIEDSDLTELKQILIDMEKEFETKYISDISSLEEEVPTVSSIISQMKTPSHKGYFIRHLHLDEI